MADERDDSREYSLNESGESLIRSGLKVLTQEIVECTVQSGWREKPRTDGETVALLHSEISEAFEGMRAKQKMETIRELPNGVAIELSQYAVDRAMTPMPPIRGYNASKKIGPAFNTVEEEFADEIIRVLEEGDRRGLDVAGALFAKMRFNRVRLHLHGGKKL